jgi:hypothetical protein
VLGAECLMFWTAANESKDKPPDALCGTFILHTTAVP